MMRPMDCPTGKMKAESIFKESSCPEFSFHEKEILETVIDPLFFVHDAVFVPHEDASVFDFPVSKQVVMATNVVVEGVHFLSNDPPETIAKKSLRVCVADLAAMGAKPLGYNMVLSFPQGTSRIWLTRFFETLREENILFGMKLFDVSIQRVSSPIQVSLAVIGHVSEGMVLNQNAAQSGDRLYVTGTIGDAAYGLQILQGAHEKLSEADKSYLVSRYQIPVPRIFLAQNLGDTIHAATGISNGLLMDLNKICQASSLQGFIRKDKIPLSSSLLNLFKMYDEDDHLMQQVLSGGNDYELIFSASPGEGDHIDYLSKRYKVPITCIGHLGMRTETVGSQDNHVSLMDENGKIMEVQNLGYTHQW